MLTRSLLLALSVLGTVAHGGHGRDTTRALVAYHSLVSTYATGGHLLRARSDDDRPAAAWPASQALAATIAVAAVDPPTRDDVTRLTSALHAYWDQTSGSYRSHANTTAGAGGPTFVDDNEWLALDLVRAHRILGVSAPLRRARRVFRFVQRAWDGDDSHACSGGVFWSSAPTIRDRNTVSTANGALLALELWRETARRSYVADAQRMLEWVDRCERLPNGLYGDHIDLAGRRNDRVWSYNQGAVLAADALLAEATGDVSRLRLAQSIADASLRHFGRDFAGEPPEFVAIFLDDLREVDALDGGHRFVHAASDYLAAKPTPGTTLLAAAARVRLLAELAAA